MLDRIEIPKWLSPPRQGALRCTYIDQDLSSMEYTVQFKVNGRTYTSFVPKEVVDIKEKQMLVHVIGSLKDGSHLVDLPSDTLISGTRIKIRKDEPGLIYDPL